MMTAQSKIRTDSILAKPKLDGHDLVQLLSATEDKEKHRIFRRANEVKRQYAGNAVYLRGLIEMSNICRKDCYYCGIRKSNENVQRYTLAQEEIVDKALWAWRRNFGSIVIQSGERTDKVFIDTITAALKEIRNQTDNALGITLSLGEQSLDVYEQWREAGAHRYLLRIETSSPELFRKIHPDNEVHRFEDRLKALFNLKKAGFQTGTGVMIGLPGQAIEDLADDLLFMRNFDVDMIGMGPYIPHIDTPMGKLNGFIPPPEERFDLALRMIALARIMMKDVNIAASTAMQVLDPDGRIKAILAGANVFMPNLTPKSFADNYNLYNGKSAVKDDPMLIIKELEKRLAAFGEIIGYGKWGDSKHYFKRTHPTPIPPLLEERGRQGER